VKIWRALISVPEPGAPTETFFPFRSVSFTIPESLRATIWIVFA
jgi:hypothetical protein